MRSCGGNDVAGDGVRDKRCEAVDADLHLWGSLSMVRLLEIDALEGESIRARLGIADPQFETKPRAVGCFG